MIAYPSSGTQKIFLRAAYNSFICLLRSKSARVITFEQFIMALTELGPKRFKGKSKEEALQLLYGLIVGKEPANAGITVSTLSLVPLHSCLLVWLKRLRMSYNTEAMRLCFSISVQ